MQKEKEVVSIVKCASYEKKKVRKALLASLKNINFHIQKNIKVLIKPNLLSPAKPEKAITTHPVIIEELCKILKEHNCQIFIGESSAYNTDLAFKVCGLKKLEKYAKLVNFESEEKIMHDFPNAKKVPLPAILFKVDLIINLAKMKTHGLTMATLCVKNLYGCVPGEMKMLYHKTLHSPSSFSHLLISLCKQIKPELNIIDGIIGIEGDGPGATGKPIKSKLIIAGKNPFATDIITSEIMGFKPNSIYTNKLSGIKRENILVLGNGKDIKLDFKKPKTHSIRFLLFLMNLFPKSKISFDKEKCKKCHLCEQKCPVKVISLNTKDGFPECEHKNCIHCLCCIEVCPHKAIFLKQHWTKELMTTIARKMVKA